MKRFLLVAIFANVGVVCLLFVIPGAPGLTGLKISPFPSSQRLVGSFVAATAAAGVLSVFVYHLATWAFRRLEPAFDLEPENDTFRENGDYLVSDLELRFRKFLETVGDLEEFCRAKDRERRPRTRSHRATPVAPAVPGHAGQRGTGRPFPGRGCDRPDRC